MEGADQTLEEVLSSDNILGRGGGNRGRGASSYRGNFSNQNEKKDFGNKPNRGGFGDRRGRGTPGNRGGRGNFSGGRGFDKPRGNHVSFN